MLSTLRPLAVLLAGVVLLAPHAIAQQDARTQRALERAERRFDNVLLERDAAYALLREQYEAAEAWFGSEETPTDLPAAWTEYYDGQNTPLEERTPERARMLGHSEFHEVWNDRLYRRSRAARAYATKVRELEKAFHALERLRHPERYQRGFDKTPEGMTLVPGGRYTIGPNTGYLLGHPDTQEERQLRLQPFYLDRHEVSCAQYATFLLAQPPALREEHLPSNWSWSADGSPLFPDGWATRPVIGVAWTSAASYAEWIGKRLPTEIEWEAAAAGFDGRPYPLGTRFDASKINCRSYGADEPRAPGELAEDVTPQGVRCLTGNVREWTADLYEEPPGRDKAKAVDEAEAETLAVVRGGSFLDDAEACASRYRWLYPATGTRLPNVGFRCAKDVK